LIQIKIPYKFIWFASVNDKMETTLSLKLTIKDRAENITWTHEKDYFLSFLEKEVEKLSGQKHLIEIKTNLLCGKYSLQVNLINRTGGEEEIKIIQFQL